MYFSIIYLTAGVVEIGLSVRKPRDVQEIISLLWVPNFIFVLEQIFDYENRPIYIVLRKHWSYDNDTWIATLRSAFLLPCNYNLSHKTVVITNSATLTGRKVFSSLMFRHKYHGSKQVPICRRILATSSHKSAYQPSLGFHAV